MNARRETGIGRMARGLRLLIRRLAAPELFPAAARTRLPATIIAATRRETPEETRARQHDCGGQKANGGLIPRSLDARCPGYSALESNARAQRVPARVCEIRVLSVRQNGVDGTGCNFQVFRRIPIKREILPYTVVCVTLTIKREYGSNTARKYDRYAWA